MSPSNWSKHWHSVRAAAGMPALEFYELKHRTIQWMIDPPEDGGLGLDPQTAAIMVTTAATSSPPSTPSSQSDAPAHAPRRSVDAYRERLAAEIPRLRLVGTQCSRRLTHELSSRAPRWIRSNHARLTGLELPLVVGAAFDAASGLLAWREFRQAPVPALRADLSTGVLEPLLLADTGRCTGPSPPNVRLMPLVSWCLLDIFLVIDLAAVYPLLGIRVTDESDGPGSLGLSGVRPSS